MATAKKTAKKTAAKKTTKKTTSKKISAAKVQIGISGVDLTTVADFEKTEVDYDSTQFDFPVVTTRPLVVVNDKKIPIYGKTAIVRTDTNTVLAEVGGHYELSEHRDVLSNFEGIISEDNKLANFDRTISMTHGGARMYASYTFSDLAFKIARGDEMHPRLTITNTYDRSHRFHIGFEFYRLMCANGMITPVVVSFSEIHTKNNLDENRIVQITNDVRQALINTPENAAAFIALTKMECGDPIKETERLYDGGAKFQFPKKYVPNALETYESQSGRKIWHLYNAFNSVINRGFTDEGMNKANRGRMLDLNLYGKFNEVYLNAA